MTKLTIDQLRELKNVLHVERHRKAKPTKFWCIVCNDWRTGLPKTIKTNAPSPFAGMAVGGWCCTYHQPPFEGCVTIG